MTVSSIDDLEHGRSVAPRIGPIQVAGMHAPTVRVHHVQGEPWPSALQAGACVNLLGNAADITIVHTAGRVYRLPTDSVITTSADCGS